MGPSLQKLGLRFDDAFGTSWTSRASRPSSVWWRGATARPGQSRTVMKMDYPCVKIDVTCGLSIIIIYIYITMVGKMSHLTFRGMLLKVFIGKNKHGVFPPSWMVQTGWLGGGWHFDLLTHWNSWSCWKRSTAELELMNLRTTSWCQLNVAHSAAGLWSFSVPFFAHGKRSFLRLLPALQRSQGGSERGESLGDWAAAGSSTVVWADGSQWWRLHFSGRVRLDGPPANQGALWISDLLSPWVLISCKSIISGMGQSLWNWGITIHSPAKL